MLSRLEEAAIALHEILWANTGDNADWPITFQCDEAIEGILVDTLNELGDAVEEVRPGSKPWPIQSFQPEQK
jgi:hypothetical protein